jgi:chemotaxis family two-component system response regulator PixH
MSSTNSAVEEKAKSDAASAQAIAIERRRRRRAKISAQVHVKAVNSPEPFEEVCMSIDVSRDGLLFTAKHSGYWKGQQLDVTFPYSTAAQALNSAQTADIVRVTEQPGGKFSVAVQFQAAKADAKSDRKGATGPAMDSGVSGSGIPAMEKNQCIVLAVEPDTRTAEVMRNMLTQDGYSVIIVATAKEALEVLRTTVPAVFIAEVEATDMSGHDLCLIIKRNERLQRVPVILLTRSAQPADYSASHQLGAVVCMAKPFQPERLQHVVRLVAPPPTLKSVYGASRSGVNSNIERSL